MDTTAESPSQNEKTPSTNNAEPKKQDNPKKSKKDDRKNDDRSLEYFMKSIDNLSPQDKVSSIHKRCLETAEENRKVQFYMRQADKRYNLLLREKEQLQLEYNKTVLLKSKLENLCRELHKQNRSIKEESLQKIREEEEKRKETQTKFQATLSEITNMLQQNNEKNTKLREDNISMCEKFNNVAKQYELREQQVDKLSKQMELESQLSEAKLSKASLEHQAEKEKLKGEMEHLMMEVCQSRATIMELKSTEQSLRSQLGVYTDKYDEFQNAIVKSNAVFGGFKGEMEKMSKQIQKLEKESLSWKKRWEVSQAALIESCSDKQTADSRSAHTLRQLDHMQRLCRTLQGERIQLLATLKEHNIERPPLPAPASLPPAPALLPPPPPENNAKMDAMATNCAQLKQSLAQLQNQLNVLTVQKQGEEAKPEKEKVKKSKSKKNKNKNVAETKLEIANETKLEVANETKFEVANETKLEIANETKLEVANETKLKVANKTNDDVANQNTAIEINDTDKPKEQNSIKELIKDTEEVKLDALIENPQKDEVKEVSKETEVMENLVKAISQANKSLTELDVSIDDMPPLEEIDAKGNDIVATSILNGAENISVKNEVTEVTS